ncbi:MAG: ATP phosphoribosyltransferase [Clostridia bacterium]
MMNIDMSVLKNDERAIFTLRSLYKKYGYSLFMMSKFEEYDLYVRNKDFLVSDNIITFNDTDGKLMALKPDVTLSIIKNTKSGQGGVRKVYYNENVYRVSKGTNSFKEIMQVGLECIGQIDKSHITEVICLAAASLKSISGKFVLDISHLGIVSSVLNRMDIEEGDRKEIIKAMGEKNVHRIEEICKNNGKNAEMIKKLASTYGESSLVLESLKQICGEYDENVRELEYITKVLEKEGYKDNIIIDFSVINDVNYYNGVVFKGYIENVAEGVLSGGQYDNLLAKMGKSDKAIGFAVYLDRLSRIDSMDEIANEKSEEKKMLNIALPKGRLGEKVYSMFEKAGFECPSIKENNRKLIFENQEKGVRYFWVKPSDVSIYVERGAADIGVAGKDILLEYEPDVYELLDLDIGKCRMAVAAKKDFTDDTEKTLRVATKFTNITKNYYASQGRDIDIIHLNGSIEIAPILGLSDVIVDIVETGTTLRENNLEVIETVVPISARLIANKSGFMFKREMIEKLTESIKNLEE